MLRKILSSAIFGSPLYNVKITELVVRKRSFNKLCDIHDVDAEAVERYGLAIHGAKDFKENQWYYTDKGNLVYGNIANLSTILAKITVDDNLNFLAQQHHFAHGDIPKWYAVEVKISGLHPDKDDQLTPGPFPLIFLGTAKE